MDGQLSSLCRAADRCIQAAWNRTRHSRPGLDPVAAAPGSLPSGSSAPSSPMPGKSRYQAGSELTMLGSLPPSLRSLWSSWLSYSLA